MGITFVTLNDLEIFQQHEKTMRELITTFSNATAASNEIIRLATELSSLVEYNQKLTKKIDNMVTKFDKLKWGN